MKLSKCLMLSLLIMVSLSACSKVDEQQKGISIVSLVDMFVLFLR
jgi:outer membrane protein assembly factor BamE (lipoprotein component of BamABCDE complex)